MNELTRHQAALGAALLEMLRAVTSDDAPRPLGFGNVVTAALSHHLPEDREELIEQLTIMARAERDADVNHKRARTTELRAAVRAAVDPDTTVEGRHRLYSKATGVGLVNVSIDLPLDQRWIGQWRRNDRHIPLFRLDGASIRATTLDQSVLSQMRIETPLNAVDDEHDGACSSSLIIVSATLTETDGLHNTYIGALTEARIYRDGVDPIRRTESGEYDTKCHYFDPENHPEHMWADYLPPERDEIDDMLPLLVMVKIRSAGSTRDD